jgi:hypothetical protein
MTKSFQFSVAPEKLWQAINPWSFYNQGAQLGFVNINLGRIGDALEVLIDHAALKNLSRTETDALAILKGQLAEIRKVKAGERDGDPPP